VVSDFCSESREREGREMSQSKGDFFEIAWELGVDYFVEKGRLPSEPWPIPDEVLDGLDRILGGEPDETEWEWFVAAWEYNFDDLVAESLAPWNDLPPPGEPGYLGFLIEMEGPNGKWYKWPEGSGKHLHILKVPITQEVRRHWPELKGRRVLYVESPGLVGPWREITAEEARRRIRAMGRRL
jgi:hypothetical protein